MTDSFLAHGPWWVWLLMAVGALAVVMVFAALFLPDWHRPTRFTTSLDAFVGSEEFLQGLRTFLNVPLLRGGDVEILQNGDAFFPAMLDAIRSARDTINFQVYIFEPDSIGRQFLDALEERARAGVEVRLLVDAFGSHKLDREIREGLQDAGCRISRFRPLKLTTLVRVWKRDHRRAIVVDGRVAFTGGGAVADKWTGTAQDEEHWRDSMTRVTGPLASGVQTAFAGNWVYCTGEVLAGPRFYPTDEEASSDAASGPVALAIASSPSDSAQPIRLLYWLSFRSARERICISSSYFIPGPLIRDAIKERARSGVDVRILVPGVKTDAKPVRLAGHGYYEELLEAGVRIFEYEPTMMHAKTVTIDHVWSIVGSSNMDARSTEINEENNLAIADEGLARAIEEGFLGDVERSREIRLEEFRRRSLFARFKERVCSLLLEQY
jgi:cardiolipin synthase